MVEVILLIMGLITLSGILILADITINDRISMDDDEGEE